MDCMEGMKEFPDKYFDLAIVDPPYRDINHPDQWQRAHNGNMKEWQKSPTAEYFIELNRISEHQIIWGGNYFTEHLPPNNNWIVWKKLNDGVHFSMAELAWNSIKINIKVVDISPDKDKIHPTQKPTKLYKWTLNKYAKPGMKIIDTHVGSGSSIIAFLDYGCEWIGFEIDPDYHKAASERIKIHKMQTKLF